MELEKPVCQMKSPKRFVLIKYMYCLLQYLFGNEMFIFNCDIYIHRVHPSCILFTFRFDDEQPSRDQVIINTMLAGFGSGSGSDDCINNGCNVPIETEKEYDRQQNHKDDKTTGNDPIQQKKGKGRTNKSAKKEKKPHFKMNFKPKQTILNNAELQNLKIKEIIHVFPNISYKIPKKKKHSDTIQSTSPTAELINLQDNVSQRQLLDSPVNKPMR